MTTDKIYLVGFMASGKSTAARALARRLNWRSMDIDDLIEQRERRTVAQIFAAQGEPYFRAIETAVLIDQAPIRHAIVATGGGTFVNPHNRAFINQDGVSVWLDAPLEQVIARMPRDGRRPLAQNRPELEQLYRTRRASYQLAHIRVDVSRGSIHALVDDLLARLNLAP